MGELGPPAVKVWIMCASSSQTSALHSPFPHQKEAYSNAVTPTKDNMHELSPFTDDCWGSQISIPDGEEVDISKFRSMSGAFLF